MRNKLMITGLVSLCFILGCSSEKNITIKKNNNGDAQTTSAQSNKIPPGQCRIVGTIISIDSTLDKYSSKDPCSIHPCNAVVRVDSIIGYGNSFPPLRQRSSINLNFIFTLGPTTKDLFPNLNEFYPGLSTGDSFIGNISVRLVMNTSKKLKQFEIYGYQKK